MMDVMYVLGQLVPAPEVGGTVVSERPILNPNGSPTGRFETLTLLQQKAQYDALRWEDTRPKPTWNQILFQANIPAPLPLIDRLSVIVDKIPDAYQAQFLPEMTAIFTALENPRFKNSVAKLRIQNLPVPDELKQVKLDLLAEFER